MRRGNLSALIADVRSMRMREVRAWLTMLWNMGGIAPRLLILSTFIAVEALLTICLMTFHVSGWLKVTTLTGSGIVLLWVFFYLVTAPRDPWENTWWNPFDDWHDSGK